MQELNKNQSIAIHHGEGPMLVLAGPGSGKTLVITKRLQTLIEEYHIRPEHILVITFTKAAASEMKSRFDRISEQSPLVHFGTFHSIFYYILRQSFPEKQFFIQTEQEKRRSIKEVFQFFYPGMENRDILCEQFLSELERVRNRGLEPEKHSPSCMEEEIFQNLYHRFQQKKQEEHKLDFEDMAVLCRKYLRQDEKLRQFWQERYRFILVDEMQDMNREQYEILKLLAGAEKNLFLVGDDDQAIYGFRGAEPGMINLLLRDYPEIKRVALDINYRSTESIVKAAGLVIRENLCRQLKEIHAVREQGEKVQVLVFEQKEEEKQYLRNCLQQREAQGTLRDCAVILRTNRQMTEFAGGLAEAGIPFSMKERYTSLLQQSVCRDILACLRFAGGSRTREHFYRFMNKPVRYIRRTDCPDQMVSLEALRAAYAGNPSMQTMLRKLSEDLAWIKRLPPYGAISYFRGKMGYDRWLNGKKEELECADRLLQSARDMRTLHQWEEKLGKQEELLARAWEQSKEEQEGVCLMTLHGAKGLEFPYVYLPEVNEGMLPKHKNAPEEEISEERRLFYVGMTRAKEELCITCQKETASRFLKPFLTS